MTSASREISRPGHTCSEPAGMQCMAQCIACCVQPCPMITKWCSPIILKGTDIAFVLQPCIDWPRPRVHTAMEYMYVVVLLHLTSLALLCDSLGVKFNSNKYGPQDDPGDPLYLTPYLQKGQIEQGSYMNVDCCHWFEQ